MRSSRAREQRANERFLPLSRERSFRWFHEALVFETSLRPLPPLMFGPGKVPLPPECAIRPRSHFTLPLENSTQGFRSATDLVTIFRPITSLTLKKVPFTAGPMH